jgi:hypothetical protein
VDAPFTCLDWKKQMTRNAALDHAINLTRIQADRDAAQRAHDAARDRGDTRGQHDAEKRLRKLTHRLMEEETRRTG